MLTSSFICYMPEAHDAGCRCGQGLHVIRKRVVPVEDLRELVTAAHALATHLRSLRCEAVIIEEPFLKRIEAVVARVWCEPCRGRGQRRDPDPDGYGFVTCPDCEGTGITVA